MALWESRQEYLVKLALGLLVLPMAQMVARIRGYSGAIMAHIDDLCH